MGVSMNYNKKYVMAMVVCGALVAVMDTSCAARERLQKKLAKKEQAAIAAVRAMAEQRKELDRPSGTKPIDEHYKDVGASLVQAIEAGVLGIDTIVPETNFTALLVALSGNDTVSAKRLLELGADPNLHGEAVPSPLAYAISSANPELIRLIMRNRKFDLGKLFIPDVPSARMEEAFFWMAKQKKIHTFLRAEWDAKVDNYEAEMARQVAVIKAEDAQRVERERAEQERKAAERRAAQLAREADPDDDFAV